MKKIFVGLFLLTFAFLVKGTANANEGILNLRGSGASCFAASIYVDSAYRILMTCRELKIALTPERTRYVAWVVGEDDKQKRLGEIVNGKMSVMTDVKIKQVFITSEDDSYGNKPTGEVLLSAGVEPIDFGKGVVSMTPTPTPTQISVTATVTKAPKATATPKPTSSTDATKSSGLGSALSTVFKIALFGFGLLLIIVGVFSFLQRRRSL
ncbi:hypothetical protein A2572_03760 [Candidatus Collierbacteria bacterium RIFOXYD1_FULL_40_9]|uniref:Uncharacterized protein n=1 Tax=Candidatus Collierbacteria bacterium RIFOXYD1_FULL_40_9 TaxID=1817731 RepID=A0A1F5FU56_9BACT|nr:MAG: hypothetical protein A2572_03760 [Candidatus Collierbacteria bacterium RIFOXYD1_FULL_40_9]